MRHKQNWEFLVLNMKLIYIVLIAFLIYGSVDGRIYCRGLNIDLEPVKDRLGECDTVNSCISLAEEMFIDSNVSYVDMYPLTIKDCMFVTDYNKYVYPVKTQWIFVGMTRDHTLLYDTWIQTDTFFEGVTQECMYLRVYQGMSEFLLVRSDD